MVTNKFQSAKFIRSFPNDIRETEVMAVVVTRKVLLRAIKELQEGRVPPYVIRDPELNRFPYIFAYSGVIPSMTNWQQYAKQLDAEMRM